MQLLKYNLSISKSNLLVILIPEDVGNCVISFPPSLFLCPHYLYVKEQTKSQGLDFIKVLHKLHSILFLVLPRYLELLD